VLSILTLSQVQNCALAASLLFPPSAVTLCLVLNFTHPPSIFPIPAPATAIAAVRQKSKLELKKSPETTLYRPEEALLCRRPFP
jgi:hypothetical protein